jgi:hypothetical protein
VRSYTEARKKRARHQLSRLDTGFKGRWQSAHLGKICRRPSRQHVQHRCPERVQVALRHRLSPELLGGHVPISAHHSAAQERRRRLVLHCPEIDHLPKGVKREDCYWGGERCTHECPQQCRLGKKPLPGFLEKASADLFWVGRRSGLLSKALRSLENCKMQADSCHDLASPTRS